MQPTDAEALVHEAVDRFGLPRPTGWTDLGGSRTTNLRLAFADRPQLVLRVHGPTTSPERVGAVQAARRAAADAGVPTLPPLPSSDGHDHVRLAAGRVAEVETFVPSDAGMGGLERLEDAFAVLARLHDALRTVTLPAASSDAPHANHVDALTAPTGAAVGAARITRWSMPWAAMLAADLREHCDEVDTAEAPLVTAQVVQPVHGDFWDDNVLSRAGRLVAVLDLDPLGVRPRVDDLALVLWFLLLDRRSTPPTTTETAQHFSRLVDAYDSATTLPLSTAERASLPLAIARQPAWSAAIWIPQLGRAEAVAHAEDLRHELPVARTVLRDLGQWQEALA